MHGRDGSVSCRPLQSLNENPVGRLLQNAAFPLHASRARDRCSSLAWLLPLTLSPSHKTPGRHYPWLILDQARPGGYQRRDHQGSTLTSGCPKMTCFSTARDTSISSTNGCREMIRTSRVARLSCHSTVYLFAAQQPPLSRVHLLRSRVRCRYRSKCRLRNQ